MNLPVPMCPLSGQLQLGEPLSSSGSIMGIPHPQEYLAPHLRRNPRGPVGTEIGETGETSNRLAPEVEGLHGNEALEGATW